MNLQCFKTLLILILVLFTFSTSGFAAADCPDCEEVAKGKIPAKFLDKGMKTLPSGIAIWDNLEAIPALKDKKTSYLWVDTRPSSFLTIGTIKKAVNLVCDLIGEPLPPKEKSHELTKDRLMTEMAKVNPDTTQVKVIYFCQGPKCHRSYNAALRSVAVYGLPLSQVIWYRDGYPNLEKEIMETPKLKRRISKYLRGDIAAQ